MLMEQFIFTYQSSQLASKSKGRTLMQHGPNKKMFQIFYSAHQTAKIKVVIASFGAGLWKEGDNAFMANPKQKMIEMEGWLSLELGNVQVIVWR